MNNGKHGPVPHIEVADPAAAFHKMEEFTRKVLSVPKSKVDAHKPAKKKAKRN